MMTLDLPMGTFVFPLEAVAPPIRFNRWWKS